MIFRRNTNLKQAVIIKILVFGELSLFNFQSLVSIWVINFS